ncbi:MAG: hypothetical protein IJT62_04115 [Oscillospiraceae bacterium]|nr:hypothetical protein [Oscillospiraceae bacterium]
MSRIKSCVVAGIIMALLGAVIMVTWEYSIWTFYCIVEVLAAWGFACMGVALARWLAVPAKEPRHMKAEDEDDAAIWELSPTMVPGEGEGANG